MLRILLASLLLAVPAIAQEPPARPDRPGQRAMDPANDEILSHIKDVATPSPEQFDRIVDRYRRFRQEQMRAIRETARRDGRSTPPTREEREKLIEAAADQLEPINKAFLADVRAMLSTEQRVGFDACVADLDLSPMQARQRQGGGLNPDAGPSVGDAAPAFELSDLDGKKVSLATLKGKPVVVEFGSYTCPIFRGKVAALEKLRAEFGDRVHWVLVYTREAHPIDGRVAGANTREGIEIRQHRSAEDRFSCARLTKDKMGLKVHVLVDTQDDKVTNAWGGFPNRGYILDAEGKVASKQVWIDPKQTGETLRRMLSGN